MHINIIAVGKIKEKYLIAGINEYLKRLKPYARVEVTEVPDEWEPENASAAEQELVREREGEKILRHIKQGATVVVLVINGKMLSSEELAGQMQDWALQGKSELYFVIGGSLGLHKKVLERADLQLSFGKMTFPHQLMRLVLVEQIYRAFKINRGEKYHK
ncbi:23S rRNA (pseudouridine(1915)-N(3))-methyltransferase RlmH [Thermincola ferriacetica]